MTIISAKVVADSINQWDHRITTMLLVMPRYILAEFNTHRMFSRNSASSRAIPHWKMVQMVKNDPFIPLKWMKDHKGMQGDTYITEYGEVEKRRDTWKTARDYALQQVEILSERYDVTKQLVNRLLEPFMWHTVLVTATEWENFFALRLDPAADIHIQVLAAEMLQAMNESEPKSLKEGEWHIPYGDEIDLEKVCELSLGETAPPTMSNALVRIATARAARTSYTLPDSEDKHDYAKDISRHDDLLRLGHVSPTEHCAQCPTEVEYTENVRGRVIDLGNGGNLILVSVNDIGWFGNFRGWKQYRKMLPNENRSDPRLIKKQFVKE